MNVKGPTDEEIRNVITPLMLSGAKMLDRHCPVCGSPLFEKDGKVFCPVCEYRAKNKRDSIADRNVDVEAALWAKLAELASALPSDVNALEKHLSAMEKIIELILKYRALEGGE
ncbi:Sjogren's syndrome/scleroderma autoantigen 1 family protein [Thermococcus sp. Bubb.Bath]|uniref:Sjogren's syndrome/scleroderma autoantigen 1 family protein n=1 Tax=Thermococcus sp. Bubb.Bath TaxID=1638242 RepID=UPI00143CAABA|nr:Sjogren's syndrome/scleroderma autoantigen 1 family protein [Thermococcus sp. Bubb.Bath]NJF24831.1 hypothetical protein [Thermococcus sp. Bubb.Bath]